MHVSFLSSNFKDLTIFFVFKGQYNGSIELPVKYVIADLPNIPYGDFRMETIFIKKHDDGREEKFYCMRVFVVVTPQ